MIMRAILLIVLVSSVVSGSELFDVRRESMTISKEAVSVPSVRILDDVVVHYFLKSKRAGDVKFSKIEIDSLDGKGDLDPNAESFFKRGRFFAVKLKRDRWILVMREIGGMRYGIGSGDSVNSLIFQRSDLKYFSKQKLPKALIEQMDKYVATEGETL